MGGYIGAHFDAILGVILEVIWRIIRGPSINDIYMLTAVGNQSWKVFWGWFESYGLCVQGFGLGKHLKHYIRLFQCTMDLESMLKVILQLLLELTLFPPQGIETYVGSRFRSVTLHTFAVLK